MATEDGGLRERKKRETRLALSHATIRLALERGFDNVSVEDIAAASNVSERTFRNYFTSKAEAVVAAHTERGHRIVEVLRERPTDESLWDALVNAVVAQFEPPPDRAGTPREDRYTSALQKLLTEPAVQHEVFRAHLTSQDELIVAIAERTGTEATDLYPQVVAAVISTGLGTAMAHWTRDPTQSLVSLLHEVFDQIRAGLPDPR
ncbi:TetR family transcriptional regulator [Actinokineospora globicatena]|uniref:acyl-CoA-like ligand-binding transcription factor n=1 Tax=Actinokineospora globicatena TaxID=103729 RepID=UPI0020A57572|nr:TetR family transcriptional regulator [Actinokineospora globicatena]MCP2302939.1 transcriptional regulator, TetR family [Actinokineospora globicatena]